MPPSDTTWHSEGTPCRWYLLRLDNEMFQELRRLNREHAIREEHSRQVRIAHPTRLPAFPHSPLVFTVNNRFLTMYARRDLIIRMLRLHLPSCCVGIVMSYHSIHPTKEESHKVLVNRGCVIL